MIPPKIPDNENQRLLDLYSYEIMDSEYEKEFDNLTTLASQICNTKISLVSLLDDKRQWFKSKIGLEANETPKEFAFCGHAINQPNEVFIIEDARNDERFFDNPLVIEDPNVIFYAGVPLVSKNGNAFGTLCVIDNAPKQLTQNQITALKTLSNQVMQLIELRKLSLQQHNYNELLLKKNEQIENFAYIAAHDLKSPLNQISSLVKLIWTKKNQNLIQFNQHFEYIIESSEKLKTLIDELLVYSKSESFDKNSCELISLTSLIEDSKKLIPPTENCAIKLLSDVEFIRTNKTAISLIFNNLISNSIKYCDKEKCLIEIELKEDKGFYHLLFKDNGPGIHTSLLSKVFNPFEAKGKDKFGQTGTGLGLSFVKKIVDNLGGSVSIKNLEKDGVEVSFKIKIPTKI